MPGQGNPTCQEAGDRVLSHLSRARTGEILRDLVRTRSQNPIDGEGELADHLAHFLGDLGLRVERPEALPGRPNVVGTLAGAGDGPVLALNTHMDTVPEGGGWTHDPFGGEVVDGRLYGRGAADAKGPLAAFLAAIEALVHSGVRLRGSLVMTAVADEEASSTGARRLVPGLRADLAIVGEPTGLRVGIAHRGSLRPVIVVTGRTAHSSRPSQGINAAYHAVPVIQALAAYGERLDARPAHPLCGSPSAAVTLVSAGIKENVIPDRCEIVLDRRMVPGETEAEALAEVAGVLDDVRRRMPGLRVAIEGTMPTTGPASEIAAGHPLVGLALEAAGQALGRPSEVHGMTGACDMTHFRAAGIPCVVLGPGDSAQAHQPDEHMDLAELDRGSRAYALAAVAACGVAG